MERESGWGAERCWGMNVAMGEGLALTANNLPLHIKLGSLKGQGSCTEKLLKSEHAARLKCTCLIFGERFVALISKQSYFNVIECSMNCLVYLVDRVFKQTTQSYACSQHNRTTQK